MDQTSDLERNHSTYHINKEDITFLEQFLIETRNKIATITS